MDNKITRTYIRRVSRCMPVGGNEKKQFLAALQENVSCFLRENPSAGLAQLNAHFGSPDDIAADFIAQMPYRQILLSEIQAVDAPPYDFLLPIDGPSTSAVWGSALSADQQFRQCVLAAVSSLLRFCTYLFDFSLSIAPSQFLLDSPKGNGIDNRRVVVFHFHRSVLIEMDSSHRSVGKVG